MDYTSNDEADIPYAPCETGLPPVVESGNRLVCRVQRFSRGGFEGVAYFRSRDGYHGSGLPGSVSSAPRAEVDKVDKALEHARRAKKTVRWKVREIGADHLVTLTTREEKNDRGELLNRFARFVKAYTKALGKPLRYVAVPEPHPSNPDHWHVHCAISGRLNLRVANAVWWKLCGGRGMGNVDVRRFAARDGARRSERIARYISKYITKNFERGLDDSGDRRFRASLVALQARGALLLESTDVFSGIDELLRRFKLVRSDLCIFVFPDHSGFWFSCSGEVSAVDPPF